jgi:type II secretory pathway pseudopilin PulG
MANRRDNRIGRKGEAGATLLAMLAVMTLSTIFLLAVAPTVTHTVQRQKELESIRRGEEVAEAIRRFVEFYRGARLPISMDELLEGLPSGAGRVQILRESASTDPLSEDGRWILIKPDSQTMVNFATQLQAYNNGSLPLSASPALDRFALPVTNLVTVGRADLRNGSESSLDREFDGVPFVGVASQSRSDAIITFYGIEKHSEWVFTPLFRGRQENPQNRGPRRPGNQPAAPRNPRTPLPPNTPGSADR